MSVGALMANRMDGNEMPTWEQAQARAVEDGQEDVNLVYQTMFFTWFRRSIRYALWPVWPNNPGVGDGDVIEAVKAAVDELVERRRGDEGGMIAPNLATLTQFLNDWPLIQSEEA